MITPEILAQMKALLVKASQPPMVVSPINAQRSMVMLTTLKPGAVQVGTFVDDLNHPQDVAWFRAEVNADLVKLLWEHAGELLTEYEISLTGRPPLMIPPGALTEVPMSHRGGPKRQKEAV